MKKPTAEFVGTFALVSQVFCSNPAAFSPLITPDANRA